MVKPKEENGRRKDLRVEARVKVRFRDARAFIAEYTHNISKGGLFIRTESARPLNSHVEVTLILPGTDEEIEAEGRVRHIVTPAQASEAQPAGMGLELHRIDPADRQRIEDFITAQLNEETGSDRRRHPRVEAKIRVRFGNSVALIDEYTRNISYGGIFIATRNPKPMHERVKVIITHPQSGDELYLEGEVVRVITEVQADQTSETPGMGIRFINLDAKAHERIEKFIIAGLVQSAR